MISMTCLFFSFTAWAKNLLEIFLISVPYSAKAGWELASSDQAHSLLAHGGPAGDGLHVPPLTAAAEGPAFLDGDMAKFTGVPRGPSVEFPVNDQAATDASSGKTPRTCS
jgi:hypothetical protein